MLFLPNVVASQPKNNFRRLTSWKALGARLGIDVELIR
jgi:hypothetical protein